MVVYKKPVCHCGRELVFVEEYYYREQRSIDEDGKVIARKMRRTEDDKYVLEEFLRCPKCTDRFDFNLDELGRIVLLGRIVGGTLESRQNGNVLGK
jgi:hypothetical protein